MSLIQTSLFTFIKYIEHKMMSNQNQISTKYALISYEWQ